MQQIDNNESFKKILGEPIGFATTDAAEKLKRNLMLVSCLVILLSLGGVSASQNVTFAGVVFPEFTTFKIMLCALVVLLYMSAHYMTICIEIYNEWSIRRASSKVVFGEAREDDGYDPLNPRQSTLYSWWVREASRFPAYDNQRKVIEEFTEEIIKSLKERKENAFNEQRVIQIDIGHLSQQINLLGKMFSQTQKVLMDEVLLNSLRRFDSKFEGFVNWQNLRVFAFEIVIPFGLALTAFLYGLIILCGMDKFKTMCTEILIAL